MSAIIQGVVDQRGTAICLGRFAGINGTPATQANTASMSYSVYDIHNQNSPVQIIPETALTIADVLFDVLQLDARWSVDGIGYNFRLHLSPTAFPTGGRIHRVDVKLVDVSSNVSWGHFEVRPIKTFHI